MADTINRADITIGRQGRMVIPAKLRRSLNIQQGDAFTAHIEDDRLILESRETVLKRIKDRFSHVPREVSMVDDLIEERREAGRKEGGP